jgi:hypothetical protein
MNMFERDKRMIVMTAGRTEFSLIECGGNVNPSFAQRTSILIPNESNRLSRGVKIKSGGETGADFRLRLYLY